MKIFPPGFWVLMTSSAILWAWAKIDGHEEMLPYLGFFLMGVAVGSFMEWGRHITGTDND